MIALVNFEIGKQQRTVPAARYAAPVGVLIAPRYRSNFEKDQSQVDPLEAAEPESGLNSVPFMLLSLFLTPQKSRFGSARCSVPIVLN